MKLQDAALDLAGAAEPWWLDGAPGRQGGDLQMNII